MTPYRPIVAIKAASTPKKPDSLAISRSVNRALRIVSSNGRTSASSKGLRFATARATAAPISPGDAADRIMTSVN